MFINNPAIRFIEGSTFELIEPLEVRYEINNGGSLTFTVPAGYKTDFASTPRLIWWMIPPNGEHGRAAILHDYLYAHEDTCSRFLADALFREIMARLKVPLCKRVAMYYAVRVFGWFFWQSGSEK